MATNLRLRQETSEALRQEAQRTGRSQQDIIREALEFRLGLPTHGGPGREPGQTDAGAGLQAPRFPYRKASKRLRLPAGKASQELLDRDDRR